MGDFGALLPREMFTAAKKEAEAFAELVETGGFAENKAETVAEACKAYAADNADAVGRFNRHIYSDPIAKVKLEKLRRHHLLEWRERLESKPALISRSKSGPKRYRDRAPSSINRDIAPFRAALFKVLAAGRPGTEAAWHEALKPIKNADRQRNLYLSLSQRGRLLEHTSKDALPFVKALCLLTLRPGAMSALSVGDFDKRKRELLVGKDKSGKSRRIIVPHHAAEFLSDQSKDKLPNAPLFARSNGKRWDKENWNKPIAAATFAAGLESGITTYTLRHSVITDLVNGGLALLTVAQISDTSVEMIERHYGHLNRGAAEEALDGLAL
ncbi:MAG: site-specific integrase [Marinomonas sp.]